MLIVGRSYIIIGISIVIAVISTIPILLQI